MVAGLPCLEEDPMQNRKSFSAICFFVFISLALSLIGTWAKAAPYRFCLDFNYAHFFGDGSVFSLQSLVNDKYPNISLSDAALEKVRVVAKSRFGHGKIILEVGGKIVDTGSVGGTPEEFDSWRPITFDYAVLYNADFAAPGPWLLRFAPEPASNGIIVLSVEVFVDLPDSTSVEPEWVPMYQFFSPGKGDHFYSDNPGLPGGDYIPQGSSFELPKGSYRTTGMLPFYRLYNPSVGDHFYTADSFEADRAIRRLSYRYEATYQIFGTPVPGSTPLYRFYNQSTGDHYYSTSRSDIPGYGFELVAGYVLPAS